MSYSILNDEDININKSKEKALICVPITMLTGCCCCCCALVCCLLCIFLCILIPFLIFIGAVDSMYSSIKVNGHTRYYMWHVPEKIQKQSTKVSLLLGLHGGSGNPNSFRSKSQFDDVADNEGILTVYPQGWCSFSHFICVWNSGYINAKKGSLQDDVDFLDALIDKLLTDPPWSDSVKVDPKKIFAVGHSNGAMMVYTYATKGKKFLAAIAPVSGSMAGQNAKGGAWYYPPFPGSMRLNMLEVHGLHDPNVKIAGGHPTKGYKDQKDRYDMPMEYSLDYWLKENLCVAKNVTSAQIVEEKDIDGGLVLSTYSSCKNNTSVRSLIITNGEHMWNTMNDPISKSSSGSKKSFSKGKNSLGELIYSLITSKY